MDKLALEAAYRAHHEGRRRYGYLFCHGARGKYLREWIGTGRRVLDLGCRDGTLTRLYAEGNSVLGADVDRRALALAENNAGIQTAWVDLNGEWPFAPASFDVIVACEILEHLYSLDAIVRRIASTLKPGGLFIGSVPNAFRMRNRCKFLIGNEFETDPTHVRMFSYGGLLTLLGKHFRDAAIVPIGGKIFPFWPVSPAAPFRLQRLFAKDLLWRSFSFQ